MQIFAILSTSNTAQTGIESECLIANLQTLSCKPGCMNCNGNELVNRLNAIYERKHFEHGKFVHVSFTFCSLYIRNF